MHSKTLWNNDKGGICPFYRGEGMIRFFILFWFLIGLIVIGVLFYLKKGPARHEKKPDVEYICEECGDKDCICEKKEK
jgi:hypothetical protein